MEYLQKSSLVVWTWNTWLHDLISCTTSTQTCLTTFFDLLVAILVKSSIFYCTCLLTKELLWLVNPHIPREKKAMALHAPSYINYLNVTFMIIRILIYDDRSAYLLYTAISGMQTTVTTKSEHKFSKIVLLENLYSRVLKTLYFQLCSVVLQYKSTTP